MTHTCVHEQRQEFNADCIFCQELRQKEGEARNASDNLFGEIIDSYPDAQALEDGFLVLLRRCAKFLDRPINRMTRHLFDELLPFVRDAAEEEFGGDLNPAIAAAFRTKCALAERSPDNTGEIGDIYRIPPNLWLVRNEVGGWTAMYPEDY